MRAITAALLALAVSFPVVAQDADPRFEITPLAAWRVGGEFSDTESDVKLEVRESAAWGLTVNGKVKSNTEWEVLYSRQQTEVDVADLDGEDTSLLDMNIDYLQVGGTYLFDGEKARPFIAMTVGASRFDPNFDGSSAKTFFSASLGAGVKLQLGRRIGLRLEARGFGTLVDNDSRLFCGSSPAGGGCLIIAEGKVLWQTEARAGIAFQF
ncbi:MAG: porin family protein [Gammaproteobacteria bacterium]|nr:porin family protein [Gammaproteobacteria bacterium]